MLFVLLFSCLSHDPITFYPFFSAGALVSLAEDEEDDEVPLITRR